MNSKLIPALDAIMEIGTYVYVFALFNQGTTALSSLGLYVPLIAWLVKHGLTKGILLGYLRHPLSISALTFGGLVLVSTTFAPDTPRSLDAYRTTIGTAMFLLVIVGDAFRYQEKQLRLLKVMAFSGLYVNFLQIKDFVWDYRATGSFLSDYTRYRTYSDSLTFFAPFTLAMAGLARTRIAWIWWGVFALQLLLLFFTGARGAWLGLGISLLIWTFVKFDKKMLGTIATIGIAAAILLTVIMPRNIVMDRIHEGISTSGRTHGTWGPSYEMMLDKPILGYGWGKSVYHNEFNRRAPNEPTWSFKQSLGPHSNYLEVGFAAGLVGMLSLILLYAKAFARLLELSRRPATYHIGYFALATLGAFIAQYLVRGFVESSRWQPLGLLLGIAVALLLSSESLTANKPLINAEERP